VRRLANPSYTIYNDPVMPRSTPTKQALNQAIRSEIPGGDFILDVFCAVYVDQRQPHTEECYGFFKFILNRLKSIRARMREAVVDRQNGIATDPTPVCKAITNEVVQDLRQRLKDPRYCKRKKLKHDHINACKKYRDALMQFIDVLDGRFVRVDEK